MLSAADAGLVQRDPHLPGLATALDPEAFVGALRRTIPEADLGTVRSTYLRYKPGTSCLVAYQLEVAGAVVDVYAKAHGPDAPVKIQKARERSSAAGPLPAGRIVLEDRAIVVSVFPNDSKLGALKRLSDPEARRPLLREILPEHPELGESTVQCLHYKPERRYLAELMTGVKAQAVLKLYAETGYPGAKRNTVAFDSRAPLRLAKQIGCSDRRRILAFEWLPGRLLSQAISDSKLKFEPGDVGAALAELHGQDPEGLERLTREEEATAVLEVARGVGFVCPHLAARVRELAQRLASQLAQEPPLTCPIHGDFYASQVLLGQRTVAVLDLDEAVRGDPSRDLGNFIAHLEFDSLHGELSAGRVEPLREALVEGYRAATGRPPLARVELYVATGLLHLAPHPFRQREPDWPGRTEAILDRIEAILKTVPGPRPGRASCHKLGGAKGHPGSSIPVMDPFGVASDPRMPFLASALDPFEAQSQFNRRLPSLADRNGQVSLGAIRVSRYKPGQRCLIEYDVEVERPDGTAEAVTLLGKARARGLDASTYNLLKSLWNNGFQADSQDGVSVPEPIGVIPEFNMWLQRKVAGRLATRLLAETDGVPLVRRIAEAAYKLHQSEIAAHRSHTMADELAILQQRLSILAEMKPEWAKRLNRLLEASNRLGAATPPSRRRGIHRDFYADQVIADGGRLYLLDFDLYSEGDPGLDIGNFLGHVAEQSLRVLGDPYALRDREEALEERFLELSGEAARAAVQAYTTLTLVRHVYLSTQFPERRPVTEALLELCEQRLGVAERSRSRKSAQKVALGN